MKKILWAIPVLSILFLVGCSGESARDLAGDTVSSALIAEVDFIDDGTIAMDQGEHSIIFTLENTGDEPIVIMELYTSCMCTTARVDNGEGWSEFRGMQGHGGSYSIYQIVEPGATADVEAVFDPNAHGPNGTGTNRRAIYIETNSSSTPTAQLGFTVDVVSTSDELDLGPEAYTLQEHTD